MVLLITLLAGWICGPTKLLSLSLAASSCMLMTGLIAGISLEWAAKWFDWWSYSELMPAFSLFGETVGLSPLMQMTLLPFLSILLATKLGNFQKLIVVRPN